MGVREVRVVPNAVRRPALRVQQRSAGVPFRLLFVGNLGYFPNIDGLQWFCEHVLPVLRSIADRPFRVRIAGAGLKPSLAAHLRTHAEVDVAGEVPDVSVEYDAADAVIVPVRAGGGTRIKVIEAFAHERPVVTTTIGAEGIEAESGRELVLAETPEDFAAACAQLMSDEALRRSLTRAGLSLVTRQYSQDAINRLVAGWS
jgi:glycosyltransferase involved in cell wall biosynthesis